MSLVVKCRFTLTSPGLTEDEILANILTFFLAGYETTANTLTFLGYELATNPEVQDKLIEEIEEVVPNKVIVFLRL